MALRSYSLEAPFPPSWPELRAVIEEFAERARGIGAGEAEVEDFVLALTEALANAMKHGCRENPDCSVWLRCGIDVGHRLWAHVRDEGRGFDPSAIPDPLIPERLHCPNGRGLLLMRTLCDEVRWLRAGTEIHLVKYLSS